MSLVDYGRLSSRNRERVQKKFEKPSLTKQSFKQECDINLIMKRFKKSVGTDYLSKYQGYVQGQYGDFSGVADYRSALDQINQAQAVFGALPSKVRLRFENDAAKFLDFVQDPKNLDEMVTLGLATKKEVKQAEPVVVDQKK